MDLWLKDEPVTISPHLFTKLQITGITERSDQVKPGDLFAALKGTRQDGLRFLSDGIEKGASAVLVSQESLLPAVPDHVKVLRSDNPRLCLSKLLGVFYTQPEVVVAVTGTDGKTSTVHFVQQMARRLNKRAACLGTLGVIADLEDKPCQRSPLTTPPAVELHQTLEDLSRKAIDYLALEASSHGLDQYRLDGVALSAAGLTNITRGEHSEYHPTSQAYYQAKARLFSRVLPSGSPVVLNSESWFFSELRHLCHQRGHTVMTYGRNQKADLCLQESTPLPQGQRLTIRLDAHPVAVTLPLIGEFQALNVLCGLGLVMATEKLSPLRGRELIPDLFSGLEEIPGRLNFIGDYNQASIYVDYAHTPNALKTVLVTLRAYTRNRLIVVFGCAGNRARRKRSLMGQIASTYADCVIVTDDNPRNEHPAQIRQTILKNAPNALEIGDRKKALLTVLEMLKPGDSVLVAGRGDERFQILQNTAIPFHDPTIIRQFLGRIP